MTCPTCKIENQPTALRCDCGHVFGKESGAVQKKPSPARAVWMLPMLGAIVAAFELFTQWSSLNGAPQQAALAGYALAIVVIPYCFARAVAGMFPD